MEGQLKKPTTLKRVAHDNGFDDNENQGMNVESDTQARQWKRVKVDENEKETTAQLDTDEENGVTSIAIKSEDGSAMFKLSAQRRVTVQRWKSTVLVGLREYYSDGGVMKPGKKGTSMSVDQWRLLLQLAPAIEEAIAIVKDDSVTPNSLNHVKERVASEDRSISFTLSSKKRVTVRYFQGVVLIDIREYYSAGDIMKPGKKGISLSKEQWNTLMTHQSEISAAIDKV